MLVIQIRFCHGFRPKSIQTADISMQVQGDNPYIEKQTKRDKIYGRC